MTLLSVENLRVSYDNIKALHGLNFQIGEGEIVCIIGANGAGKSTTLRAISRMVKTEPGSRMTLQGKDLLGYSADRVVSELSTFEAKGKPPQTTRARLRGAFIRRAQERRRDFTVDWVHLKLNELVAAMQGASNRLIDVEALTEWLAGRIHMPYLRIDPPHVFRWQQHQSPARALELAERHVNKELDVVAAFLCDDPAKAQAMMKVEGWTCRAAMVPGGRPVE